MNDKPRLQLVVLYNARDREYSVLAHNLTPEQAAEEVARSRRDGFPAFAVDQRHRHPAADAEDCRACSNDVTRSFHP